MRNRHRWFGVVLAVALWLTAGAALADDLPPGGSFIDDNGDIHEPNIEAIAAAGITKGCNPPVNDMFCPDAAVTRGAMAAFLVRALDLVDDGGGNLFVDDDGSVFESDIDKLGTAGITLGCNPPMNDMFCPDAVVTRAQMASFLARALELDPIVPPPPGAEVSIEDFFFSPDPVEIKTGETVTWTNDGGVMHTSTSGAAPVGDGTWDSGGIVPGDSFSHMFDTAGMYEYFCAIHPLTMQATVTVTD